MSSSCSTTARLMWLSTLLRNWRRSVRKSRISTFLKKTGNANIATTANGIEISLAEAAPVAVYSVDGKCLYNAASGALSHTVALDNHGIYLVKVGNKTTKVAR